MDTLQIIGAAVASAVAGFFAYLRTKKGKAAAWNWIKRLVNVDPSADDLRSSVENMTLVVDAQGQSIGWLTEQQTFLVEQLNANKEELAIAREQLKELEALHKENTHLKKRVKELEAQVAKLEAELERRKKYTPKAKRGEEDVQK
jgi:predicted RNase H-like nuclease (RuvC/YqgF family)